LYSPVASLPFPFAFRFGKSLNNRVKPYFKFGALKFAAESVKLFMRHGRSLDRLGRNLAINIYVTHVNGTKYFIYIANKVIFAA
jgi:hypothetical protein